MMTVVDDNLETVREAYRKSTENLKSFRNVSAYAVCCYCHAAVLNFLAPEWYNYSGANFYFQEEMVYGQQDKKNNHYRHALCSGLCSGGGWKGPRYVIFETSWNKFQIRIL